MIAFIQPYPFDGAGGGARILRSLTDNAPRPFLSVVTCPKVRDPLRDNEVHVPQRPYFGSFVERANRRLGGLLEYATPMSRTRFERDLKRVFVDHGVTAVHAIPHGIDFWYAFRVARTLGLPYVLNVHDDLSYNLSGDPLLTRAEEKLGQVWREADHRFVISDPMGEEYDRRYGARPWTMLTDGITELPDAPATTDPKRLQLYFMGSVHLAYERNFTAVINALDIVHSNRPDLNVEFVIRGGMPFRLPDASFPITVLGWGTQEELKADMTSASMLYFPLPFEPEYESFARWSLSTKMITYLASGLPILYHGPGHAAACKLLDAHEAALLGRSDAPSEIAERIEAYAADPVRSNTIVQNALSLGRESFQLATQQQRLWATLTDLSDTSADRSVSNTLSPDAPSTVAQAAHS